MADQASDVDRGDPDGVPRCATCGEPIGDRPTHRVLTWIEDGHVEHRHFCDPSCRESWTG